MIKKYLFLLLASFFTTFFAAYNFVLTTYSAETNLQEYQSARFCNFTPSGIPTGDITLSSQCVVYENINGVANGNLILEPGSTITLHHDLVYYPGYKIDIQPGALIYVNSNSQIKQGKICILDQDSDGYADPVTVRTDPSSGTNVDPLTTALTQIDSRVVTQDPYTCDEGYVARENFTSLAYVDTGAAAPVDFATGDNVFLSMGFVINNVEDVSAAAGDIQVPNTKNLIMLPGGIGGKIGIGTTNPTSHLTITGDSLTSGTAYLLDTNHSIRAVGGQGVYIDTYGVTDPLFVQQTTGNVGIGAANPGQKLEVNGNIRTTVNNSLPNIVLDSSSTGDNWTDQGAFISLGESGSLGGAALHLTYTGDGYGFIGSGAVVSGLPSQSYLRFSYNTKNIYSDSAITANNFIGNLNSYASSLYHIDNVAGDHNIASSSNNSGYSAAALEVRELNFASAQSGAVSESPRISFHWGNRVASQIGMGSDGDIRTFDNPGTNYEDFVAKDIRSRGTHYIGVYGSTAPNNLSLVTGTGSPISGRLSFGTDGSGWKMAFAENQGGTITDIMTISDSNIVQINGQLKVGASAYSNQTGDAGFSRDSSPTTGAIYLGNSGSYYFYFNGTSYQTGGATGLGIGANPGTYRLYVPGGFYAGGSSREWKENIVPLQLDSSKIYQLEPVSYDYKPEHKDMGKELSGGHQFGLIAEDVYKVYPELSLSSPDKKVANVDYEKLGVLLLAEMKNHKKEIDSLKLKNIELEKRLQVLENKLNSLVK